MSINLKEYILFNMHTGNLVFILGISSYFLLFSSPINNG